MGREFYGVGGFPNLSASLFLLMFWWNLLRWKREQCLAYSIRVFRTVFSSGHCLMGYNKMTTLKKLILYPTHGDLARRLSPNGGPENYKVKHTPQVQSYEQLNRINRTQHTASKTSTTRHSGHL